MKFSARRILIFFLIFLFCITPLIPLAYAQASAQTTAALPSNTNPDVPKNLHTHTQSVMIEVMAAMICQLTGRDVVNKNQTCLGVDQQTGKIGFTQSETPGKVGGAIGMTTNVIGMTFTQPIHTGDYVLYLVDNFGITKSAYAAQTGTGFDSLSPIMNLWVAFRNLVYFFFIAIFIILGFGIMLRFHIDARTVMTISNQLPHIIVAILLVTFSFAISGLLIDLMWTSIYVTSNVITSVNGTDGKPLISQETAQGVVQSTNVLEAANIMGQKMAEDNGSITTIGGLTRIADEPAAAFADQMPKLFDSTYGKIAAGLLGAVLGKHISDVVNGTVKGGASLLKGVLSLLKLGSLIPTPATLITGAAANILDGIFGVAGAVGGAIYGQDLANIAIRFISWLVIAIAILWALIRLSFELIKAYIFILIDVVFAPFWILGGLIPGSSVGFGAWLKSIIAHLSVFPVTIGMFLLGSAFMKAFGAKAAGQFAPPMINNPNAEGFAAFIGLGIILMVPEVLTMMKELIKAPSFKQSGAWAGAIGYGMSAINIPQHMQKLGQWGYYSSQAKNIFGKGTLGASGAEAGGGHKGG